MFWFTHKPIDGATSPAQLSNHAVLFDAIDACSDINRTKNKGDKSTRDKTYNKQSQAAMRKGIEREIERKKERASVSR